MADKDDLTDDCIQPFQIEHSYFRGRLVRLGPALDTILRKHAYPDAVASLLAETVVVATALASSLKYEGKFTLQAKGDGAVTLLVADVTSEGGIRGYAQFDEEQVAKSAGLQGLELMGQGYLAFTVDQGNNPGRDTYQGIVELRGHTIAEATQFYFRQSEQIPTGIIAAAQPDLSGVWRGACLMIQRMPQEGGIIDFTPPVDSSQGEDNWQRVMMLMSTCTTEELSSPKLMPNEILFRLFHEEGVRVFKPRALQHSCTCAVRVVNTLRMFGPEAVEDMAENGVVTIVCQFCNASYSFTGKQRAELFASVPSA